MITRALLFLMLLTLPALAQIQLFRFDGTNETPVGAVVNAGSATPGDTVETRFHVRNTGAGPAVLSTLSLAGSGFAFSSVPSLYTIAPGQEVEFRVAFHPTSLGSYSAFLLVNTTNVILQGTAAPAAVLTLTGSNTPLTAGATIDFGSVLRGGSHLQAFTLSNPGTASIAVATLVVSGTGFRGPIGAPAPIQLAAGQTASFQVAFEPQSGQPAAGTLTVDQRTFKLTGLGLDPPLPGAAIAFASQIGASAQQNNISIPLSSPAPVSGTGTLTMEFHSSVAGVSDDPSIQFLSGPRRVATVTISAGDTVAKFGGQTNMAFQTGATAGTIVFTLTLPNATQQASLAITAAAVGLDSATCVRRVNDLDVSITGFDNTYTASLLEFTFYDKKGAAIQPGRIRVDATSSFRLYFSSTQVAGMFGLLATFPVTGDVTQVGSVVVGITNSIGVATTQQITF